MIGGWWSLSGLAFVRAEAPSCWVTAPFSTTNRWKKYCVSACKPSMAMVVCVGLVAMTL
jgi:hypothetical protein